MKRKGMKNKYTHIIPYCAVSTGKRNGYHLNKHPWRWLLSPFRPKGLCWTKTGKGYAIDNGAFVYGQRDLPFDEKPFLKDIDQYGEGADWIVLPDVLYNADATLQIADYWIDRLKGYPLLIVAQDGMTRKDLEYFTKKDIGVFVGGSTDFKLASLKWIAPLCKQYQVLCHVGRVNTLRRVKLCMSAQVHSFDGSGPARFEETARLLTDYLLQLEYDLFPRDFDIIKQKYVKNESDYTM